MVEPQPQFISPTWFQRIVTLLDRRQSNGVAPYVIYYGLRTPPHGRCFLGWHGIDDISLSLIDTYAAALRRAYDYFSGLGWVEPRVDPALGHIPVYVVYVPIPFTSRSREYTILVLRSEIEEPTIPGCLAQAVIDACHEVVHTFTHVHRPLKSLKSDNWKRDEWSWFDEATAVYFERELCPGNPATLRFARVWVNQPAEPVEFTKGYAAAWLVQHLVKENGLDFLRDVWQPARPNETPVVAINRLLGTRGTFADLVHRYAVSSYRTETMDPHASQRFGRRRFSYVARLTGNPIGSTGPRWDDTLGPLGCRYYKIDPGHVRPVSLRIELQPKSSSSLAGLRAEAILEPSVAGPSSLIPLRQVTASKGAPCLQADITLDDSVSYVVLTVVNTESGVPVRADDRVYDVRVTV
jgi:Family of unknown function (DUF6055)